MTNTITIYGASDDLIEVEGYVSEEFDIYGLGTVDVILTAPDGATLTIEVGFCEVNTDGWAIVLQSHGDQTPPWPIRFVPRPGANSEGDPAIQINVPDGTTVGCPLAEQEG